MIFFVILLYELRIPPIGFDKEVFRNHPDGKDWVNNGGVPVDGSSTRRNTWENGEDLELQSLSLARMDL